MRIGVKNTPVKFVNELTANHPRQPCNVLRINC